MLAIPVKSCRKIIFPSISADQLFRKAGVLLLTCKYTSPSWGSDKCDLTFFPSGCGDYYSIDTMYAIYP